MKRIIDINEDYFEIIKHDVKNGSDYKPFVLIANSVPYEERPQGEWIKVKEDRMSIDMSGELVTQYKCSKCGRMIATLPSKLSDYPFCHCGADMRKGDKE